MNISDDCENKSTYEKFINNAIYSAYRYLANWTGYDKELDRYYEYSEINDSKYIFINAIANDINIQKIVINETELDLLTDIEKKNNYKYEIINSDYLSYDNYYIEYKSNELTGEIESILRNLIIFELQKLPFFNNSLSKSKTVINEMETEVYQTDRTFYYSIKQRLDSVFINKFVN